jgi:hypothetical protein
MPNTAKKTSQKSTKKLQNKSAFIRSLGSTVSAAEVVAKAKAAGISLSEKYVWNIRAAAKAAKKAPAVAASKKASVVAQPTPKKPANKTAFVLSLPRDIPAAEVMKRAKAQGIELTDKYVYNIRASARSAAKKKTSVARAASVVASKKPVAAAKVEASAEELLKALAASIGVRKALAILEEQMAAVRAVLGG